MARTKPRGLVLRKPDANMRVDEQEQHMRHRLQDTKPRGLITTVNDAALQSLFIKISA
jgi:hypothetical protein